ncbi:MAG: radical SAM protein [Pseudomonadota bacterium]
MELPSFGTLFPSRRKEEPSTLSTYCGSPIKAITPGLPKLTTSLCPTCSRVIEATLNEKNGDVWMDKVCPEHGAMSFFVFRDANLFKEVERWTFGDERGFSNPPVTNAETCPTDCGMCNLHVSHTAIGMVDLTNRCNLKCPVCYANANVSGMVLEPSYDEVVTMLQKLRDLRPVPCQFVQFAGGEPTIHPRVLDIIKKTKEMGFTHIQCPTNGIRFADAEFTRKTVEAGLHTLYLQFDGFDDEIYRETRGAPLMELKMKAIENMRANGARVVLVPTILKGLNDHQVGDIVRFAVENVDVVTGISFQPVCFSGRISKEELDRQRYTLGDLAHDVEDQTNGLMKVDRDWVALSSITPFSKLQSALTGKHATTVSSHPHCSIGGFLFVDKDQKATAMTEFLNYKALVTDLNKLAEKTKPTSFQTYTKIRAYQALKKHFNPKKAPKGLTWDRFLKSLDGYRSKEVARAKNWQGTLFPTVFVAGMHFMDHYNYDVERAKRCVVHYSTQDGKIYPFCTYNAGPYFREKVEAGHQIPMAEYLGKTRGKPTSPTTGHA